MDVSEPAAPVQTDTGVTMSATTVESLAVPVELADDKISRDEE